jgi:hypothetical protein
VVQADFADIVFVHVALRVVVSEAKAFGAVM